MSAIGDLMKNVSMVSCVLMTVSCSLQGDEAEDIREIASFQAAATFGSSLPDYVNILDSESDGIDQSVTTEHGFEFHSSLDGTSAKARLVNRSNARISGTVFTRAWCSDQSSPVSPNMNVTIEPLGEQVVEVQCLTGTHGQLMRGAFFALSSMATPAGSVGSPNASHVVISDTIDDGIAVKVTRSNSVSVAVELRGQQAIGTMTNRAAGGQNLGISTSARCSTFFGEVSAPVSAWLDPAPVASGASITTIASCPSGQIITEAMVDG